MHRDLVAKHSQLGGKQDAVRPAGVRAVSLAEPAANALINGRSERLGLGKGRVDFAHGDLEHVRVHRDRGMLIEREQRDTVGHFSADAVQLQQGLDDRLVRFERSQLVEPICAAKFCQLRTRFRNEFGPIPCDTIAPSSLAT